MSYHTARCYLPWLGRWLSADPIQIAGGINLYNYGNSNSVANKDINGYHPALADIEQPRRMRMNAGISPREQRRQRAARAYAGGQAEIRRQNEALDAAIGRLEAEEALEVDLRDCAVYGCVTAAPATAQRNVLAELNLPTGSPLASAAYTAAIAGGYDSEHAIMAAEAADQIATLVTGTISMGVRGIRRLRAIGRSRQQSIRRAFTSPASGPAEPQGNRIAMNLIDQYGDRLTVDTSGKVRMITMRLDSGQSNGSRTTEEARAYAREEGTVPLGRPHAAGHGRDNASGGRGDVLGSSNVPTVTGRPNRTIPQLSSLNSGQYREFERKVRRLRTSMSPDDTMEANIYYHYGNPGSNAPTHIYYRLRVNGQTVVRALFDNAANAPPQLLQPGVVNRALNIVGAPH